MKREPMHRIEPSTHFSGKRRSRRFPTVVPVELRSQYLLLRGETIDVSQDGFRARLNESSLKRLGENSTPLALYETIEKHFAAGLEALFPRQGIRAQSRVVRLLTSPKTGVDISLGFKFAEILSDEDWARLCKTPS